MPRIGWAKGLIRRVRSTVRVEDVDAVEESYGLIKKYKTPVFDQDVSW